MKRQTTHDGQPITQSAPYDLPDGWKWARLSDVCTEPQYGYTAKARQEPVGPKMLRITDIQDGSVDWSSVPFCKCDPDEFEKYALQDGDILFARTGSVGKSFLIAELAHKAIFASYLIRVRALQSIDSQFLYFFLQSSDYWRQIEVHTHGAVQPNVNATQLETLHIPLPPLPEQRAIAHALRTIQRTKGTRQRELNLERERKAALMEHLFTHGTRNEPRKQTEIGAMPESWRVVRLGDEAKPKGGRRLPKGEDFADAKTPFPYIRVVDLEDGSVNTTNLKYLRPEIKSVISQYTIAKQNIYISIAGTIGLVGTIPDALDGANLTENAAKIVINDLRRLDNHFLFRYLESKRGQQQIQNLTAKTTQPKLALGRIEQIRIPLPSLDEQRIIASTLRACDTKIAALEREAAVLDELFRAMVDELMTGRIRTSVEV